MIPSVGELNTSNSQILGSPLPSEPPGIKNWFSSYVYESPELSKWDGFEDSDDCVANGKRDNMGENGKMGKCNIAGVPSAGFTKCNGTEDLTSAAEVSGFLDSIPLTSEPPGIQNWFPSYVYESPSYVYESPQLNTSDGVENSVAPRENDVQNEKEIYTIRNGMDGKSRHALIIQGKGSSSSFAKYSETNRSTAEVLGFSDALSFSPEPLDIRNWFSSYAYESPQINEIDNEGKEANGKVHVAQGGKGIIEDHMRDHTESAKSTHLQDHSGKSAVIIKCNSLIKDEEHDQQPTCEDTNEDDGRRSSTAPNNLTSTRMAQEILQGLRLQNHEHSLKKEYDKTKPDNGECSGKLDYRFINKICHKNLEVKTGSEHQHRKSLEMLIGTKDCDQVSPQHENLLTDRERVTPKSTSSSTLLKEKSMKRQNEKGNDKENLKGTESAENGFISTRKSRSKESSKDNIGKLRRIQPEALRIGAPFSSNGNEDTNERRNVLCEKTNFQEDTNYAMGSRGKWHCPQKRKPDLGPPLKQLRLEQWIRPR